MRKTIFVCIVVAILTGTTISVSIADYTLTNGSPTEAVWVTYSTWHPASWQWPAGWRTQGWKKIEPSQTTVLPAPAENRVVYIRMIDRSGEITLGRGDSRFPVGQPQPLCYQEQHQRRPSCFPTTRIRSIQRPGYRINSRSLRRLRWQSMGQMGR